MLCRILTELKLLDTSVGVITLSAGVANDVVGTFTGSLYTSIRADRTRRMDSPRPLRRTR